MIISPTLVDIVEGAAATLLSAAVSAGLFSTLKSVLPEFLKSKKDTLQDAELEIEAKRAELQLLEERVDRLQEKIEFLLARTKADRSQNASTNVTPRT